MQTLCSFLLRIAQAAFSMGRRDTEGADDGASVKSPGGAGVRVAGPEAFFLTPGVEGGRLKTYAVAVFRSGNVSRPDVRAHLHGEQRRAGCVRTSRWLQFKAGLPVDVELATECGHDLRRLFDKLQASQKERGVDVVNRTKRPMRVAEPEGAGYGSQARRP